MAITINATSQSNVANSYITLSDAQDLIDGLVEDEDVVAWASATTDQKNRALYTATQRIDRERFLGARSTDTQALQWPRDGVRKPDTYINTYSVGFPFRISTDYYTSTEIPIQIKHAQIVLAVYLHNNKDALGLTGLEAYRRVGVEGVAVEPYRWGPVWANNVPPMFEKYFTGLRVSSPGNIAIRRSQLCLTIALELNLIAVFCRLSRDLMASAYPAGIIITNTAALTGRFGKVHCLTAAECTFVAENLTENGSSTINGITMGVGSEVEGVITSITLASGQVIAYRI